MREPDNENISGGQKKVTSFLASLGLVVESETKIGPYRVDIYLPELKTVVEFDGPWMSHSAFQNLKRDEGLKAFDVKEVIHLKGTSKEELDELAKRVGAREDTV